MRYVEDVFAALQLGFDDGRAYERQITVATATKPRRVWTVTQRKSMPFHQSIAYAKLQQVVAQEQT